MPAVEVEALFDATTACGSSLSVVPWTSGVIVKVGCGVGVLVGLGVGVFVGLGVAVGRGVAVGKGLEVGCV